MFLSFTKNCPLSCTSLVAQIVKYLPAIQETWVQSLGPEDPLKKGMVTQDPLEKGIITHSSILAWNSMGRAASQAIVLYPSSMICIIFMKDLTILNPLHFCVYLIITV